MTLSEFIAEVGDEAAARLFGVATRTAAAYRRGEREPSTAKAREIVAAAGGRLTFEDCFSKQGAAA